LVQHDRPLPVSEILSDEDQTYVLLAYTTGKGLARILSYGSGAKCR